MPVAFLTPLQDFSGSQQWHLLGKAALWPTADFLWAAPSGDPLTPPPHCKIARLQANASLPHFNLFYNMHAICHLQALSYTHSKALARRWYLPPKQLVALGISVSN